MRARTSAPAEHTKNPSACWLQISCIAWVLGLSACSGGFQTEPLVEYSTELTIQGSSPQSLVRQLRAGIYVVEVRERDIDVRVGIDAGKQHAELADAYLRHGLHRTVVSLEQPAAVRISVSMCSFSTGARAGSNEASSASVACRHGVFWPWPTATIDEKKTAQRIVCFKILIMVLVS